MAVLRRCSVDAVAEFLHSGGPPLNADDAAVAIVDVVAPVYEAEVERKETEIAELRESLAQASAAKGEAARLRVENWQARQDVLRLRDALRVAFGIGELGVHDEQNARLASADRERRRKAGWFRRLLEWFRDPGDDDSNEPPTRDQLGRERQYFG